MKTFLLLSFSIFLITSVSAQWDKVYKEREGIRLVLKDGKYGFINSNNKVVIKPQFDDAFNFKNGHAIIKIDGKFGFVNLNGKIVVEPKYDKVFNFSNNIASVSKDNKFGYVNEIGKEIVPINYDKAFDFENNGLGRVQLNNKEGKFDKQGTLVIPIEYQRVYREKFGLTLVKKDNKYGYVNTKGKLIIPIIYDDAFDFDKNYQAKVKKDGKTGKISLSGNVTWNIQIGDIVNNGIVFYVDKSGRHGLICSKKNVKENVDFLDAKDDCRAYEGYNSWRLPTLEEAKIMLSNSDKINDRIIKEYTGSIRLLFSGSYWTSTSGSNGKYYKIDNNNPNGREYSITIEFHARAVKEF